MHITPPRPYCRKAKHYRIYNYERSHNPPPNRNELMESHNPFARVGLQIIRE